MKTTIKINKNLATQLNFKVTKLSEISNLLILAGGQKDNKNIEFSLTDEIKMTFPEFGEKNTVIKCDLLPGVNLKKLSTKLIYSKVIFYLDREYSKITVTFPKNLTNEGITEQDLADLAIQEILKKAEII